MKLSLLLQYLRIFDRGTPVHRLCIGLSGLVILWGLGFSVMAWAPCFPVHAYWDLQPADAKCYGFGDGSNRTAYVLHTAINMLFDMVVLAIPATLYIGKIAQSKTRIGMLILLFMGVL